MEQQLFDWDGWDEVDTGVYQFYDVVLKVQIGRYEVGEKFDQAVVDFQNGFLELRNDWEIVATFNLHLRVGDRCD